MAIKKLNYQNLVNNAKEIKYSLNKSLFCAVVKSNAYGHDLKRVSLAIEKYVDYYCVIDNKEALDLRNYTQKPILVLGKLSENNLQKAIDLGIEFCVSKSQEIDILQSKVGEKKIHIALNSGMNRLGVNTQEEFDLLVEKIQNLQDIKIVGVFSHISDTKNKKRTLKQYEKFKEIMGNYKNQCLKHFCSSNFFNYPKLKLDMCRVGIALYGYSRELKPVMEISSNVIEIKRIKKGEFIGYQSKHRANKDMTIAILDIGYADGLPRKWAKKGYVIINNTYCKIVAEICMNMTIVDITDIHCEINDKAIIIGSDKDKSITAQNIAKATKTIPYEILTNFNILEVYDE